MILQAVILFFATILQNGSFTLVSRARNSGSLWYNAGASVLSNGIWALVMRYFVPNLDSNIFIAVYVAGAVIGSVLMQWIAIRYLEKPKKKKKELTEEEVYLLIELLKREKHFGRL